MENQVIKNNGNFEFWFAIAVMVVTVAVLLFCIPGDSTIQEPRKIEQIEKF